MLKWVKRALHGVGLSFGQASNQVQTKSKSKASPRDSGIGRVISDASASFSLLSPSLCAFPMAPWRTFVRATRAKPKQGQTRSNMVKRLRSVWSSGWTFGKKQSFLQAVKHQTYEPGQVSIVLWNLKGITVTFTLTWNLWQKSTIEETTTEKLTETNSNYLANNTHSITRSGR